MKWVLPIGGGTLQTYRLGLITIPLSKKKKGRVIRPLPFTRDPRISPRNLPTPACPFPSQFSFDFLILILPSASETIPWSCPRCRAKETSHRRVARTIQSRRMQDPHYRWRLGHIVPQQCLRLRHPDTLVAPYVHDYRCSLAAARTP